MLVLPDAGYFGYDLWNQAAETGADLLWRVRASVQLPVIKTLTTAAISPRSSIPPGSRESRAKSRSRTCAPAGTRPATGTSRWSVVEYEIPDRKGDKEPEIICLITATLDRDQISALELAAAYHQRWEIELGFGELKTRLHTRDWVLRSKSPDMIEQEIWALLLTHHCIRRLMC
jgi:hypothetical protein